jgi:hypothetical protein
MMHSKRVIAAKDSAFAHVAETDDEFWARMEHEYPGEQHTQSHLHSADQVSQDFDEPDAPLPIDDDWDDLLPRNTSLREHAHLTRNGFRWDGDERYPKYEHEPIWRDILDSDGRPAGAKEGHVIERNTHVMRPVLPGEDVDPLGHPWMHTYYPAGQSDDEALVGGYNTAHEAAEAAQKLALYGPRHPETRGHPGPLSLCRQRGALRPKRRASPREGDESPWLT